MTRDWTIGDFKIAIEGTINNPKIYLVYESKNPNVYNDNDWMWFNGSNWRFRDDCMASSVRDVATIARVPSDYINGIEEGFRIAKKTIGDIRCELFRREELIREEVHNYYRNREIQRFIELYEGRKENKQEDKIKYFYIGIIRGCTPETIYKIGITNNIKNRTATHERHWKKKWELLKTWKMENAEEFKFDIRQKYKSQKLTTGLDFFYFGDLQLNEIITAAEERKSV
jgi:hypothetical protein